ncbi:HAMP domain-containing sensor histidine kinase [Pedobacter aquatilis]|uniref:sensor histidine kinase n=1 Tax=Pedobacter aquatilis TaxID=351343 RepID=UPI00292FC311|nr:HAMP domain-containing sensor histidine kinase [Pedobacter aquatilis]
MRLLTRTSLNYLWISIAVLCVGAFLLFGLLFVEVSTEIKEQLELQEQMVSQEIRAGKQINFPLVKIAVVSTDELMVDPVFKDTLIYDPIQRELEGYYLLRKPRLINEKVHMITVMTSHIGWTGYSKTIIYIFGFIAVVLLFIGSVANYLLNKKIWKPFSANLKTIKNYSVSQQGQLELIDSTIDEFKDLNLVIKSFSSNAKKEFIALREFTENASHEIQTPLAIIKSRLERISQYELTKDTSIFLADAKVAVDKLSRINKGLLLLAKLENSNFPDEAEIDLKEVITQNITLLEDIVSHKGIGLEISLSSEKVYKSVSLVNILVSNMLSNMLNHTDGKKLGKITLNSSFMQFANTGTALDFAEEDLFKRFKKNKQGSKGNGLGLAIVNEICKFYDWKISHKFDNQWHIFNIDFNHKKGS